MPFLKLVLYSLCFFNVAGIFYCSKEILQNFYGRSGVAIRELGATCLDNQPIIKQTLRD